MSDPIVIAPAPAPAPAPTQSQIQSVTQPLIDDAVQLEHEVAAIVAAYKAGGAPAAAALLPALAPELSKDYNDVVVALPTIKAGYATTEFWIVVVVEIALGVYTALGKVAPVDGAAVIGALAGIYAVVRGLIKK